MAGRPWRTAGFADLRDNNNDVEMPDTRAGVSRLPHSSRHQREGLYGVTPRPPPSTPDVRAMAKVEGISVDFREGKSGTGATSAATGTTGTPAAGGPPDVYSKGISAYTEKETDNATEFLKLLGEMRWIPNKDETAETAPTFQLTLIDTLNIAKSWTTLEAMMYNFFTRDAFNLKLTALKAQSRVRQIVTNILTRKRDRLSREYRSFLLDEYKPGTEQAYPVVLDREAKSPINMIELKSIIDAINVATASIKNSATRSVSEVGTHEPPFFPRLSEDEKRMVWNWVNVKQEAMEKVYHDKFYQFATLVAGAVNLSDFGLDKLITSAFKQTPTYREYKEMPSTIADDPFLSSERDALFTQLVDLNAELQESRTRDKLRIQQGKNYVYKQSVTPSQSGNDNSAPIKVNPQFEQRKNTFITRYGAVNNEIPDQQEDVVDMENDTVPPSTRTKELELRIEALSSLTDAFVSENSRQRMLWAVKWMMQPEILQKAEMQPIFASAIAQALFRVRQMCPSLRDVTDAKMFYESPDSMVVTAFAELVSQQITRTQFFHQTRVMLDKTHDRNQQMEVRLKWAMKNFRFNGTHVLSEFSSPSSSGTCSALYAF